jgi:peroxiredoxin
MNAWAQDQNLKNIKVIPDGNCEFTEKVGMVCVKDGPGFGKRSWRYSAIINDGVVEKLFEEPGKGEADEGSVKTDPYEVSSPEHVLKYLQQTDPRHNQEMRG